MSLLIEHLVFFEQIKSPDPLCAGPLQCNMGEPAITRSIVGIPPYYNQRYYSFHNFQSEFSRTPTKYRVCRYNKCFSNLSIKLVAISLSVCLGGPLNRRMSTPCLWLVRFFRSGNNLQKPNPQHLSN